MSHPPTFDMNITVDYGGSNSDLQCTGERPTEAVPQFSDYTSLSHDSLLGPSTKGRRKKLVRPLRLAEEIDESWLESTPRPKSNNGLKAWWLEIVSMSISIGSLVSIAVVLSGWQDRPLSSWRFRYLPNSVISQLMTITRSTLMLSTASCISQSCWLLLRRKPQNLIGIQTFDGASRGPAGAAILLFTQFKSIIALLGAFITVSTLLMESFTQQVIQYPLRVDVGTTPGTFPVTQFYAPAPLAFDGVTENEAGVNSSIQAAVVDSFFGVSLPDMYSCPTNSCSWFTWTTSIGLCSNCTDVTAASNSTCGLLTDHGQTICNYSTPLGLHLQATYWIGDAGAGYQTRIATDARVEADDSLVTFASLTMTNTLATGEPPQTEITECTIDWCAKVYSSAKMIGRQFSPFVHEYPVRYLGSWKDFSVIGPVQPEYSVLNIETSLPAGLNFTYTVQRTNARSLAGFLVRALRRGNLTESSGGAGVSEVSSFSFGAALMDQPSISFVANKLAVSLSNAIRGLATEHTQQVEGQSFLTTQYIRVRWAWLILPSAVVLLGIVLLVATIYQSRRVSIAVWKSSPLALLFHPLEGWSDTELNDVALGDMGKSAKAMSARLTVKDGQSWRISRTSIAA